MAAMKTLWEDINYLLDTTKWSCEEVANYLEVPVSWVNEVVEERWNEVTSE
jgi:predicted XRE-type DNA-binding protein